MNPQRRTWVMNNRAAGGGYILVRMKGQQQPVSMLAQVLRNPAGRPVVDRTELNGSYDFLLEFSYDPGGAANNSGEPPTAPDLNTALREQLGVQLVAKKVPFDTVVVDSVDPLPTEN
jgi:uncharacterized protein (TIGR03435 family)